MRSLDNPFFSGTLHMGASGCSDYFALAIQIIENRVNVRDTQR
jgi:hypothetical protein